MSSQAHRLTSPTPHRTETSACRYQAAKVQKKQAAKEKREQETAARQTAIKAKLDGMTPEEKDAWLKQRQTVRQASPCSGCTLHSCRSLGLRDGLSAGAEAGRPAKAQPHAAGPADGAAHRDRPGL